MCAVRSHSVCGDLLRWLPQEPNTHTTGYDLTQALIHIPVGPFAKHSLMVLIAIINILISLNLELHWLTLVSAYYVPGTVLNALGQRTHLLFKQAQIYYHVCFTDEETEI